MQLENGYYPDHSGGVYEQRLRERFQLKRLLTRIFIEKDFGFKTFKKELLNFKLKIPINKELYKHLSQSMVYKIVRAAETLLIVQALPAMKRLSLRTIKFTYYVIEHCRKFFSEEDTQTIFKLAKQEYQLARQPITVLETEHFYRQLLQLVQSRAGRYYHRAEDTIFQELQQQEGKRRISYLTSIWDQEYEAFLLETYNRHQCFSKMRTQFQNKYPQQSEAFTAQSLCHQFYFIMKQIFRKIEKSIHSLKDPSFPQLVKLKGKTIRRLVSPSRAEDIRRRVVYLYRKDCIQRGELLETVHLINDYFNYGKQQSKSQSCFDYTKQEWHVSEGEAENERLDRMTATVEKTQSTTPLLENTLFDGQEGSDILGLLEDGVPSLSEREGSVDGYSLTSSLPSVGDEDFYNHTILHNIFNLDESSLEYLQGSAFEAVDLRQSCLLTNKEQQTGLGG